MDKLMPREKLAKFGAAHLTDLELLRLLIGSGNKQASAEQIARRILKLLRDKGSSITYEEISRIQGMGPAKTSEIIALFELGKRYLMPADRPKIENAETAVEQLGYLRDKRQECFVVLTLDGANRLIDNAIVFRARSPRVSFILERFSRKPSRIEQLKSSSPTIIQAGASNRRPMILK